MIRSRAMLLGAYLAALSWIGVAHAACVYEGLTHPEGTRIGVLVCEGGSWVPRP